MATLPITLPEALTCDGSSLVTVSKSYIGYQSSETGRPVETMVVNAISPLFTLRALFSHYKE